MQPEIITRNSLNQPKFWFDDGFVAMYFRGKIYHISLAKAEEIEIEIKAAIATGRYAAKSH